jgi:hypothetical protein
LLRLCVFYFSSTLAQVAVLLQGDPLMLFAPEQISADRKRAPLRV